jgi:hypothetical protein
MRSLGGLVTGYFAVFMLGAILGRLMADSASASAILEWIVGRLGAVAAVFAWHAANWPEKLPRKTASHEEHEGHKDNLSGNWEDWAPAACHAAALRARLLNVVTFVHHVHRPHHHRSPNGPAGLRV